MDHPWVRNVIINFITNSVDIFGENSTYQGFEVEEESNKKDAQKRDDGFNSRPYYGNIIYQDERGNVHKSNAVMLKIMPSMSISKFISFQYLNEMNFYTKIIPAMNTIDNSFSTLFPKFYHGEMTFAAGKDKSMMILEDLKHSGYKMAPKKSFLDLDHLMLMMRKLGQFHAFSYKAKRDIPELFHPLVNNIPETNFLANHELRNFLRLVGQRALESLQRDPKYEKYVRKFKALLEKTDEIYVDVLTGDTKNPLSVFCHGDYLRNNIMFKYENNVPVDLKLVDMATCRYASPVIDLLGVLYMNCDQSTRNTHWNKLIDQYYTALKETFPKTQVPCRSTILSEFVGKSFYGYLITTYFLPSLIADDNNIPFELTLDPEISRKFQEFRVMEIPKEILAQAYAATGGEIATKAVSDVLKDMIDRRFVCT
ncbi:uncharacterized protein LOC135848447 [Planococcus citri]|uniref:uncharacterized protein LOC135848447 n=1 Tax=Planococcus citri TaxID=170843 RepID=UPI0031F7EC29